MSFDYKGKYEEFRRVSEEIRSLADVETMDGEQSAKWDKLNAEASRLEGELTRAKKAHEVEARAKELAIKGDMDGAELRKQTDAELGGDDLNVKGLELRCLAQAAWFKRQGGGSLSEKEQALCKRANIDPNAQYMEMDLLPSNEYRALVPGEARAQSAQLGAKGGYTVGQTMVGAMEIARLNFGSVRAAADVIRTGSGDELKWPTVDDTSNTASILGENGAASTTDVTMGQQIWYAHKLSSDFIKVPFELLEDSVVNIQALIGDLIGERLGRKEETLFTTGTGAGQPYGIVNGSVAGKTTASATAVTMDEILDLIYSVGTAYRRTSSFMMNPGIVKAVRKLKDGQGQYLWQPSTIIGQPSTLQGYSIFENEEMQATLATGTKTILFGDLSKYKVREVGSVRFKRLEERFADNDQVAFIGFSRIDGKILNAGTNPIKHMLQA